ncbi:LysR family transcriptional regulator [Methylobacterium brachythecii]|uniref:DNA-binding transcriptional LysR family regulator n=1 Tax=Methylobacterium brachythecii TaxID=1176177 RepID=A0A7W6F7B5_9HYPH|nr:LysR substrate-binding domain-containing protein [Methylobacterium brachythecii]MBB3903214.1 DNA-binding transcriptional LysR family regulator [Methylobacterium brachythecii]GLS45993.1 LysR family transcriptional regulator [Methylobacterium brachythecii]
MDIRQFRYFIAVAEQLHFAKAADLLGISPPSITKQIQDVERELGVRLFNRTKRSVSLTAAGAMLLDDARMAVRQAERAVETARLAGRGQLGRIEIGYVASTAYSGVLQEQITAFKTANAGVDIRSREVAMDLLPDMLDTRRLDVAFLRPPMEYPPGIASVTLVRDPFIVACRENSRLGAKAEIAPADLANETFILPEQIAGVLEVGRLGGFVPKLAEQPGNLTSVVVHVSLGAGVSIVPSSVAKALHIEGVVYRPLLSSPVLSEIAVAFRRGEAGPATRAFIAQLRAASLPAPPSSEQDRTAL